MYRPELQLRVLLGAALLAGCSDRSTFTAPSSRALASTVALADRPYTWTLTCNGNSGILAEWSWTENGTVLASSSADCSGSSQLSGTGVRPATANGFTATVGNNSKSWTFDPAGPFKASLSDSEGGTTRKCHDVFCHLKESGQLNVDS
jgi:hypothetical protein